MKAIVITAYGGPEVLALTELPDPVPAAGEVLIRVRAFGLNHAETYMRSGAWGEVAQVPGIECAGTVEADPGGRLAAGTPVVAILGGMGRTRNGSYAELVTVPASNVVPVPRHCRGPTWWRCRRCTRPRGPGCTRTSGSSRAGPCWSAALPPSLGQAAVNVAARRRRHGDRHHPQSARTDLLRRSAPRTC